LSLQVKKVGLGSYHAVALSNHGQVITWGSGISGQLGHDKILNDVMSTVNFKKDPQIIISLSEKVIVDIAVGSKHNIALADDGSVFGWGCNSKGQLGLGQVKGALRPKVVKLLPEK
jgi:alpha-tubulin suppressor-like RCC1 family protein